MIDYKILDDSIKFYKNCGYTRIESPWTVTPAVDDVTRPKDRVPFELVHNGKRLVASGEQSFLYLMLKGFLPPGKYQTVTPCFRNEPFDLEHTKYFVKNELIWIKDKPTREEVMQVRNQAHEFFKSYLNETPATTVFDKNGETDIVLSGSLMNKPNIELGSYGSRKFGPFEWIYGTGLAEPRFSSVLNQGYGLSQK